MRSNLSSYTHSNTRHTSHSLPSIPTSVSRPRVNALPSLPKRSNHSLYLGQRSYTTSIRSFSNNRDNNPGFAPIHKTTNIHHLIAHATSSKNQQNASSTKNLDAGFDTDLESKYGLFLFSPYPDPDHAMHYQQIHQRAHDYYLSKKHEEQQAKHWQQYDKTLNTKYDDDEDDDDIYGNNYLKAIQTQTTAVKDTDTEIHNDIVDSIKSTLSQPSEKRKEPKPRAKMITFTENGPKVVYLTDSEDEDPISSSPSSSSSEDTPSPLPPVVYNEDYWQVDPVTRKPLEPDPFLCCGNDCQNCVWIQYDEQMLKWKESLEKM